MPSTVARGTRTNACICSCTWIGSTLWSTNWGAWEIQVPPGIYNVSVGVGDPQFVNSVHRINIEGQAAIAGFAPPPYADPNKRPRSSNRWDQTTATVQVNDGRLTIAFIGGSNTKINYVVIEDQPSPPRPYVSGVTPHNHEIDALRNTSISTEVHLVDYGFNQAAGVDERTLTSATVKLTNLTTGAQVPANVNTSGGGDVIVLQPIAPLENLKQYAFEVTDAVKDLKGASFIPFRSVFTTGSAGGTNDSNIVFDKVFLAAAQARNSTVVIGPDGKLYAGTISGDIHRLPILADGTLGSAQVISTVKDRYAPTPQFVIGMAFRRERAVDLA